MGIGETLGFSKTATFLATVHVHELVQVPLLNAKFRIKWKFKGATHTSALDDPAHSLHSARTAAGLAEASRRFLHPRTAALSNSQGSSASASDGGATEKEGGTSRSRSGSPLGMAWSSEDGDDARTTTGGRPLSRGNTPPVSPDQGPGQRSTSRDGAGGVTFTSPFSKDGSETLYASPPAGTRSGSGTPHDSNPTSPDGPDLMRRRGAGDLSSVSLASPASGSSSRNVSGPTAIAHRPEPKGTTTFVPLRSHTATFNREITCPVLVTLRSVGGGKYELQTSPVRFAIKQEVVLEDGKREEERLGEVILDLSQFAKPNGASADEVKPRRYLLQGCKSNAVLRVSVRMEWLDGERNFLAPRPRSAQIATGSAAAKGLVSTTNSPASRSTLSLNHKSSATNLSGTSTPNGRPRTSSTTSTSNSRFSLRRTNSVSSAGSSSIQNGAGPSEMSRTSSRQGQASDRLAVPGSASRRGSVSSASNWAGPALSISIPGERSSHKEGKGGSRDKKPKKGGWHPPRSSVIGAFAYATAGSAAPFELGVGVSTGTATDRSATDVIDAIFNRPVRAPYSRRPSWAMEGGESESGGSGGGKMSGTSTPTGRLGAPFEYRHGESKQHHHLSVNTHHFGFDRFKGKKAAPKEEGKRVSSRPWSMRSASGTNEKKEKDLQDIISPAGVSALPTFPSEREDPPTPIGATYAQVEAPAVRKKQEERAKLVRDVTYEIGVARGEERCSYDTMEDEESSSDDGDEGGGRGRVSAKSKTYPPGLSVAVQPPTPQIPFPRTNPSPTLPTRSTTRPKPPSPSSSAHSSAANSTKPLSVRWGDQSTSTSSSAGSSSSSADPSPATSVLPSPNHRQLRHQRSTDSALSVGRQSTRSAPLDTPSSTSRRSHRSRPDPPPSRPASSLSFNSFITPPSPPPVKDKRHNWGVLDVGGGRKAREKRGADKRGEKAPGGVEWTKSWA